MFFHNKNTFRADKKFLHELDGIGDGCDVCLVNPRLFNNLEQIRAGFNEFRGIGMYFVHKLSMHKLFK